jgi:ABC-type uncharacterized transport system substrate-binding protein
MHFHQWKRREVLMLLGGAAAARPLAARAQQAQRVRRIGVLGGPAEDDSEGQARQAVLRQALQELGWTEGRNIRFEYRARAGGNVEHIRRSAADLVALGPDVIVVTGGLNVQALQLATRTIPIVFVGLIDPVGAGFIDGLARPGGNTTAIGDARGRYPRARRRHRRRTMGCHARRRSIPRNRIEADRHK